jgi:ribonuclease HII
MSYIIGADEVGMGSWSGPIVIVAIKAPIHWEIDGLRDSKKLDRPKRAAIATQLLQLAKDKVIQYHLASFNNDEIDAHSLGTCHKRAFAQAINMLHENDDSVIIDGNLNPTHFAKHGLTVDLKYVQTVVKADDKYPAVMAASILAKHYRDMLMVECHKSFPQYGWDVNAGYIVAGHREAVRKFGLTCLHRKSYNVKL